MLAHRKVACFVLIAMVLPLVLAPVVTTAQSQTAPNIVLIVTDDQRWDTLSAMPIVRDQLTERGVRFSNAFTSDPLCCPSRASILKGAYPHTTRVYANGGPNGPFPGFDDRSTVATWLDAAGYRTGLVGKYFNDYGTSRSSYVPPGWDRWTAFVNDEFGGGAFFNYQLSNNGVVSNHGAAPGDYSTDVLAGKAVDFISETPPAQPLFLYFTPYAPHQPATPAPRHAGAFQDLVQYRPPSYNEPNVADKPAHIRREPLLDIGIRAQIDDLRVRQYQTLLAVDEAVGAILGALEASGRLGSTMIVFTSDNGFVWGEHRWGATGAKNKLVPYEESIRVPLVVRYDRLVKRPRTDPNLAVNIDFAPTFAELTGVAAPGAEGRSLLPLLRSPTASWRQDFLVEQTGPTVPAYCAVRTRSQMYAQYSTGEEELYNLGTDRYQQNNLARRPQQQANVAALRQRASALCQPPPPGFK